MSEFDNHPLPPDAYLKETWGLESTNLNVEAESPTAKKSSETSKTLPLAMYSAQSENEAVMRALERLSRQPRKRRRAISLFKVPPVWKAWMDYIAGVSA